MPNKERFTVERVGEAGQASQKGVQAFVEAKFGLTAHWGLYSINGRGEWVYYAERIPYEIYHQRMQAFNPTLFNAEEWADLMVEAGVKFFVLTSKHHDGFCLWDSALTEFKVTNTAFKRDIISELAPRLRERGIKFHFYYSLVDWTHPAYRTDWAAYVAYYQQQLRELLTNYGEIGGIVFDGYWPRSEIAEGAEYFQTGGPWDLTGTYQLIHQLQPDAVVVNNTHVLPLPGEDYQVWELDLPGENTIGFNTSETGSLPYAAWWNLNQGWSYAPRAHKVKGAKEILETIARAWSKHAVFLLNVGPRSFGDIHPEEQQVLREIGQMLRAYRMI
jgi:alpha-L-fucosidase